MARREHDLFWSNPDDFTPRTDTTTQRSSPRRRRVHGRRQHPASPSLREQLFALVVGVALVAVLALPVPNVEADRPLELQRVAVVLPR